MFFHVLRLSHHQKIYTYIDNLQNSKNINIYEGMEKHLNDNYNMTFTEKRKLNKNVVVGRKRVYIVEKIPNSKKAQRN